MVDCVLHRHLLQVGLTLHCHPAHRHWLVTRQALSQRPREANHPDRARSPSAGQHCVSGPRGDGSGQCGVVHVEGRAPPRRHRVLLCDPLPHRVVYPTFATGCWR
mmetsp:Transcript_21170/g.25028  ORF Transcript_21170/g.25028 Transcript_21170/m.25028 type:complete len:105 (+) Transcript_21170:748-1062(+)